MIGCRRILSGEDRVADVARASLRNCCHRPRSTTASPVKLERLGRIEPPAMRRRRAPLGIVGQAAAGARVGGRGVAMRRGQRLGDVGAGAEAGDRPGRAPAARRARLGSAAVRCDWTSTGSSQSTPSQRKSSKMPSTNSGLQRVWSRSSIRSRNLPPLRRARAWPIAAL